MKDSYVKGGGNVVLSHVRYSVMHSAGKQDWHYNLSCSFFRCVKFRRLS